jgi:hypothetical protein
MRHSGFPQKCRAHCPTDPLRQSLTASAGEQFAMEVQYSNPPPAVSTAGASGTDNHGRRPPEWPKQVGDAVVPGFFGQIAFPDQGRDFAKAIKAATEGVISDMAFELQQETSMGSGSRP